MLAYEDETLEYFTLLGDDVAIRTSAGDKTRSWLRDVESKFQEIDTCVRDISDKLPKHFGVVAIRDETFPGFPTFPVVSRAHIDIFKHLFPPDFVNQDGDPYLWEIYRPFGARRFAENIVLNNRMGGDEVFASRYSRQHIDWKSTLLPEGIDIILKRYGLKADCLKTTIDVIVPSFRCQISVLEDIVSLSFPNESDVRFIIIVDDPSQSTIRKYFEDKERFRDNVFVRVNEKNMGASFSRNRGLDEATAQWVLFLDDDVKPYENILHAYVEAIREDGNEACGFAGKSNLPMCNNSLTAGLTMSYLTYFWGVATLDPGGRNAPWAVTANLLTRRGKSRFDLDFSKTGGGEDIAYVRDVMKEWRSPFLKAPSAKILHPWWDKGKPNPWRFFGWAISDSLLLLKHTDYTFYSSPNATELALLWFIFGYPLSAILCCGWWTFMCCFFVLTLSELGIDVFRLMVLNQSVVPHLTALQRFHCSMISCVYKNFNELGHTCFVLKRLSPSLFCKRMDWWYGLHEEYIGEKQYRDSIATIIHVGAIAVGMKLSLLPSYYVLTCVLAVFCVLLYTVLDVYGIYTIPLDTEPMPE